MQLRPGRRLDPTHIVAGRQAVGVQVARGLQQVGELDDLVAADTGQRRLAAQVAVGEIVDHALPEARFVVQHIVRKPRPLGDPAGIADVLPCAAGARPAHSRAVIVELQRDADNVIAFGMQHRGGDGTVDTAGHRHRHPRARRRFGKAETIGLRSHGAGYRRPVDERNAARSWVSPDGCARLDSPSPIRDACRPRSSTGPAAMRLASIHWDGQDRIAAAVGEDTLIDLNLALEATGGPAFGTMLDVVRSGGGGLNSARRAAAWAQENPAVFPRIRPARLPGTRRCGGRAKSSAWRSTIRRPTTARSAPRTIRPSS